MVQSTELNVVMLWIRPSSLNVADNGREGEGMRERICCKLGHQPLLLQVVPMELQGPPFPSINHRKDRSFVAGTQCKRILPGHVTVAASPGRSGSKLRLVATGPDPFALLT